MTVTCIACRMPVVVTRPTGASYALRVDHVGKSPCDSSAGGR